MNIYHLILSSVLGSSAAYFLMVLKPVVKNNKVGNIDQRYSAWKSFAEVVRQDPRFLIWDIVLFCVIGFIYSYAMIGAVDAKQAILSGLTG